MDKYNDQSSLDWFGTYEGTLPCADCKGTKTMIVLNEEWNFTAKEDCLKKSDKEIESDGKFTWHTDGVIIKLAKGKDDSTSYKVVENAIIELDTEGNEIIA